MHLFLPVLAAAICAGDAVGADDALGAENADVQPAAGVKLMALAPGTAKNTVNVVIFRKSSVTTHGDTQFAAFYDSDGFVILAKRKLDSDKWEIRKTQLKGSLKDAHNAINIGVDGDGVLHIAWDHHNNPLNYRRGKEPYSLELVNAEMTGADEKSVTYPEFHPLPGGNLLFLYRDGASGRGNLAMNLYDVKAHAWRHLFSKLIDGEGHRNPYWQACTDAAGGIHISWVWRESPDVASNHDVCYARSTDGGMSWTRSNGEKYTIPITAATAEHAADVPAAHELMNQTSMTTDSQGHPYIATYFRPEGTDVPQYFVIYHDGTAWHTVQAGELKMPFRLGGGGTKRTPISRPQILTQERNGALAAQLVFRAEERGNRATLATCADLRRDLAWSFRDLTTSSLGQWELTYDLVRWQRDHVLDLFIQHAEQVDGEGVGTLTPQMTYVGEVESE